ncbi:MAG: 3-oxoacyl-ACP reductase FabG [Halobacteriales archaeon]|nr:3-oxoacyl-ACP reductase FabG [Halobacteriales archaeon]
MSDFREDIAVVTGGTKGIGRAVATQLAAGGATTIATYAHDDDAAEDTVEKLRSHTAESTVRKFDVSDYDAVSTAFSEINDEFGPPSVLVNCAGVMRNSLLIRMKPEEWQTVLETNLTGTFHCMREAGRLMLREGGGRIVNVSSIAAQRGWAGQANYAASKAGIIGLTRSVARELGGRSIRVNAVCPGYTDTDLYRSELKNAADDELQLESIPENRIAEPEEIADGIVFLASDNASYVNGAILRIDGGLLS